MKRILALALAGLTLLSLSACQPGTGGAGESPAPSTPVSAPPEAPADEELFASFLAGETAATVDAGDLSQVCGGVLTGVETLTLPELTALVNTWPDSGLDGQSTLLSYATPETLSGRRMLALRYEYADAAEGPAGTRAYFILGAYDGRLRLTYAVDGGYRSYVQLCQDLIFSGTGSNGAGDESSFLGYIDKTGRYRSLYQLRTLYGQWVAMYAYDVFEMDTEWAEGCMCYLLFTEDGAFYQLDVGEGTDPEKVALLREYLAGQGMTEIDSVEDRIAQLKAERGIGEVTPFEDWTPWESEG